jgi:hypothetical protein
MDSFQPGIHVVVSCAYCTKHDEAILLCRVVWQKICIANLLVSSSGQFLDEYTVSVCTYTSYFLIIYSIYTYCSVTVTRFILVPSNDFLVRKSYVRKFLAGLVHKH